MKNLLILLFVLSFVTSCGSEDESASDTDGLGVNDHKIFITASIYDGNFNGVTGADDACAAAATAANLSRDYMAIISDDNYNAKDRLTNLNINNPVYVVDGSGNTTLIVAAASDLWDADTTNILNLINRTAAGNILSDVKIWTGSDIDGTLSPSNCNDFSSNESDGSVVGDYGDNSKTDGQWLASGTGVTCNNTYHLYCISQ